jgi:hypothetical protein
MNIEKLLSNTKEMIPIPPFISYRVFSDNKLRSGIVSYVWFHVDAPSLIGSPTIKYDESVAPIPRDERFGVPYLVDISLSVKDAWDRRVRRLKNDIYHKEKNIKISIEEMERVIRNNTKEIELLTPQLEEAEKQLKNNL